MLVKGFDSQSRYIASKDYRYLYTDLMCLDLESQETIKIWEACIPLEAKPLLSEDTAWEMRSNTLFFDDTRDGGLEIITHFDNDGKMMVLNLKKKTGKYLNYQGSKDDNEFQKYYSSEENDEIPTKAEREVSEFTSLFEKDFILFKVLNREYFYFQHSDTDEIKIWGRKENKFVADSLSVSPEYEYIANQAQFKFLPELKGTKYIHKIWYPGTFHSI